MPRLLKMDALRAAMNPHIFPEGFTQWSGERVTYIKSNLASDFNGHRLIYSEGDAVTRITEIHLENSRDGTSRKIQVDGQSHNTVQRVGEDLDEFFRIAQEENIVFLHKSGSGCCCGRCNRWNVFL